MLISQIVCGRNIGHLEFHMLRIIKNNPLNVFLLTLLSNHKSDKPDGET